MNEINEPYKFVAAKFYNHEIQGVEPCLVTCSIPIRTKTTGGSYITVWKYVENAKEKFQVVHNRCIVQDVGAAKISARSLDLDTKRRLLSIGLSTGGILVLTMPRLEPYFRYTPQNPNQMYLTKVCLASDANNRAIVISTDHENVVRLHPLDYNYSGPSNRLLWATLSILLLIFIRIAIVFLLDESNKN